MPARLPEMCGSPAATIFTQFNGGSIDGFVDSGAGDDSLVYSSGDASLVSDEVFNFEHLSQSGGTLTLLPGVSADGADYDFSFDDVAINGGELVVGPGATLNSPLVSVGVNGVLSGIGEVTGDVVNEGVIAPGDVRWNTDD